jgi:hypothetical protein
LNKVHTTHTHRLTLVFVFKHQIFAECLSFRSANTSRILVEKHLSDSVTRISNLLIEDYFSRSLILCKFGHEQRSPKEKFDSIGRSISLICPELKG